MMLQMQQIMQMQQQMGNGHFQAFPQMPRPQSFASGQMLPGMMPQPFMPSVGPSMKMGLGMHLMGQPLMQQ